LSLFFLFMLSVLILTYIYHRIRETYALYITDEREGEIRVDIGDCGLYTHLQRTWRIYNTVESGNISDTIIIIIIITTETCLNVYP
jgi:hypothetical protein